MKKLTKILSITMLGGMLLTACGDVDDMDSPEVEEPVDEDVEEDLDLDEDTDE